MDFQSLGIYLMRPSKKDKGYLAINDFADALEAFPADIVRQFTLLKEIDAKCTKTQWELNREINQYLLLSQNEGSLEDKVLRLAGIKENIVYNLPCYEEKMTIANLAVDLVAKHIGRINQAFECIVSSEIPKIVKYGPKNHPAIMTDGKLPENKSVPSQRSESRREAIAARKAAQQDEPMSSNETPPAPSGQAQYVSAPVPVAKPKPRVTVSNTASNGRTRESTPVAPVNKKKRPTNFVRQPEPVDERKRQKVMTKKTRPPKSKETSAEVEEDDNTNEVYCVCQQVSFGEMIACDRDQCKIQWFHLQCVGLDKPPTGRWYCDDCKKAVG